MTGSDTRAGYRSGFAVLYGPANAGKSTLMNALVGEKVSIVSPRPQTTRQRISGIKNTEDAQLIWVDTPGALRERRSRGGRGAALFRMIEDSRIEGGEGADLRVLVLDANDLTRHHRDNEGLKKLLSTFADPAPEIIALNKIDLFDVKNLLPLLSQIQTVTRDLGWQVEVIPLSAVRGEGLDLLQKLVQERLPEGPQLFPEDMITDQTEEQMVAEVIREKLFHALREELPYSTAVRVTSWDDTPDILRIAATVFVERESQKGMVIGKGGSLLKQVGTAARKELEIKLQTPIFLTLKVQVEKGWPDSERGLSRVGLR
jgi:GTPase